MAYNEWYVDECHKYIWFSDITIKYRFYWLHANVIFEFILSLRRAVFIGG